jgi:predicted MFS family arabinose efflux permease
LIARLASGYLVDRFFAPHIAVAFFGALAVGIALLRISRTAEPAFLAAFLVGLGLGAEGDLLAYLTSRYFGLRSFGAVYGYTFAAFLLAGALGGYLMGVGFDRTRSYALPLTGFFVTTVVAVILLARLGPYRFDARRD